MLLVNAPKEGMLLEKIKLQQPVKQHISNLVNQPMNYPMQKPDNKLAAQKATKSICESHMHRYVEAQAADGFCYDGIVEHVDDEWLCLAVPGAAENQMRGFYSPYSQYGSYYPYRPRRFNRLALPLAGLTGLSLLPYY
jgi:hypothetical protein